VTHLNPNSWASCWLPGTHLVILLTTSSIQRNILSSVLSYISGLCTAAVEWRACWFLRFCSVPSRQNLWPMLSIVFHAIHNDEYCIVLVAIMKLLVISFEPCSKMMPLSSECMQCGRCTATRNLQKQLFPKFFKSTPAILPAIHEAWSEAMPHETGGSSIDNRYALLSIIARLAQLQSVVGLEPRREKFKVHYFVLFPVPGLAGC